MSRRCPNCDQRLLEDEAVCWHCGARLEAVADNSATTRHIDPEQTIFDRSLVIYGGLTVFVALAALLLTLYLGG